MRAKALEPVTLVRSPTLTNKVSCPMETGSRPDNFMGGTAFRFMEKLTWVQMFR